MSYNLYTGKLRCLGEWLCPNSDAKQMENVERERANESSVFFIWVGINGLRSPIMRGQSRLEPENKEGMEMLAFVGGPQTNVTAFQAPSPLWI